MILMVVAIFCIYQKSIELSQKRSTEIIRLKEKIKKAKKRGYDIPIEEKEKKESENDCKKVMELTRDIYKNAEKGTALNVVLSDNTILKMRDKLKKTKCPVTTTVFYSDMGNYQNMDRFLKESVKGEKGSIVAYNICSDGSIARMKYIFDGTCMYLLNTNVIWNKNYDLQMTYISYTRIKDWKYTHKGWFCYELCVPEPPEVSEVIDGSCLVRVKPMTEEQRRMSQKCVKELGYQGNNLLCSNWDTKHMQDLDYNGMFEYLYQMKHKKEFPFERYPDGVPKEQFEHLIMDYLPITAEQIQTYAVFDDKKQTYPLEQLKCGNYSPTFFGTSLPEVTDVRKNKDGTVTLTVDAVCDMVVCDDAVITHKLTVRFQKDGSFQYLSNKILNGGIRKIPDYQYRVNRK